MGRFKAYITKYALTKGIQVKEVEEHFHISPAMVSAGRYETFHKPHWHESEDEALKQAEKMRLVKMVSLETQLARLKNLIFVIKSVEKT